MSQTDPRQTVEQYHQQTKHQAKRFARGPEFMDWENQPEPFRRYAGAPTYPLPVESWQKAPRFNIVHHRLGSGPVEPISARGIATLLRLSLGLAAWKVVPKQNDRWSLRCNPSSGNLHPTEGYLVLPSLPAEGELPPLPAGVYHYDPFSHQLEQRACTPLAQQSGWLNQEGVILGLSSIPWRELWKYGERAYRYCQLDTGHAIAGVRYAAAMVGWSVTVLNGISDEAIENLLGLHPAPLKKGRPEGEQAELLMLLTPGPIESDRILAAEQQIARWADMAKQFQWQGTPNQLSPYYMDQWPIVDAVAEACHRPAETPPTQASEPDRLPKLQDGPSSLSLPEIILQRRSAQKFDGQTALNREAFWRMLDRLLPRPQVAPWDSQSWPTALHPLLFVHRVDDLEPGVYLLIRRAGAEAVLRNQISKELEWEPVAEAPTTLPLYRLVEGDCRHFAMGVSCRQSIAGDSAFSLGMLAEWQSGLEIGPWHYRNMFWEAGMLGHVLYLEAEAEGLRGTGIGCFFDDIIHDELLGMEGMAIQSLYHFTVGGAVEDERLSTEAPYGHLAADRQK
uniref:Nitroreductase domain-containing protein n=1 Tax=Magnetococcus massalia (strain MO-1) TaxID=451514 RepID=A0A1S7LJJ2_MAGMO|nr:conserved protein of unknown function [Candidatus Magnetococcus massalia]